MTGWCVVQRFKGTEVEQVTEEVKAVKIEEKPKETQTEVVDEVGHRVHCMLLQLCYMIPTLNRLERSFLLSEECIFFTQGPPKFTKAVLKKGDKTNFPKKGDTVSCWYTGTLEDGTVFDTNIPSGLTIRSQYIVCLCSRLCLFMTTFNLQHL